MSQCALTHEEVPTPVVSAIMQALKSELSGSIKKGVDFVNKR